MATTISRTLKHKHYVIGKIDENMKITDTLDLPIEYGICDRKARKMIKDIHPDKQILRVYEEEKTHTCTVKQFISVCAEYESNKNEEDK